MQGSIIGKKVEKDHLGAGTRAIFLSDAKKISLKHKWKWKQFQILNKKRDCYEKKDLIYCRTQQRAKESVDYLPIIRMRR